MSVRRWIRITFALAILLVLTGQGLAHAATVDVGVEDFEFDPEGVAIRLGDTVRWTNRDEAHTSTSDDADNQTPLGPPGVGWWDSGVLAEDQSFPWDFTAAGTFSYHCAIHPQMRGVVFVPLRITRLGPRAFVVRWGTELPTDPMLAFDIQRKNPGGTFSDWVHTNSELGQVVRVDRRGTYSFRARLTRDGAGLILGTSLYSPTRSITIS
jgi:plastocyanin